MSAPPPLPEPRPLRRYCIGCGRPWDEHDEAEAAACVEANTRDDSHLPAPIRDGEELGQALQYGLRWRSFGYRFGGAS